MNFSELIPTLLIYSLPVLFAITLHEAAHAYVARRLGDNTAWLQGRVTLNPMSHIDPMGTLLMPLMLFFATGGSFLFGYARPVPVNFNHLRHPKRDMVWVALAGPASNFVQAFGWALLMYLLLAMGVQERYFLEVCKAGINVNVVMFVFNLFPLPPLDGGRIMVGLLPHQQAVWLSRLEPYGFFIVMALVVMKVVDALWMSPLMTLTFKLLSVLLSPFKSLLLA